VNNGLNIQKRVEPEGIFNGIQIDQKDFKLEIPVTPK